jgi:hypothetical protein
VGVRPISSEVGRRYPMSQLRDGLTPTAAGSLGFAWPRLLLRPRLWCAIGFVESFQPFVTDVDAFALQRVADPAFGIPIRDQRVLDFTSNHAAPLTPFVTLVIASG